MNRLLLAALLCSIAVVPAGAEQRKTHAEQTTRRERSVIPSAPIEDQSRATGLPGVNLAGTSTTEGPSGPGGLQNGVGAVGTLTPSTSSSNGQLLNDSGNSIGIPFGGPASAPR